jgi:glycosyltransferase involved in cell wall biosynthesis
LLEHIKDSVDEILVIDGFSTDDTVEVAKRYGARVYQRKPWGYVEPDRMFALRMASYEWILYLDDDEKLGRKLKSDLRKLIHEAILQDVPAYMIPRINLTSKL